MNISRSLKLILIVLAVFALGCFSISCKKEKTPELEEQTSPVPTATAEPGKTGEAQPAPEEKTEEATGENKEEGEKVDSVKGAFQYTGKEMEKGFKKSGSAIKKAFVGDSEKK